MSLCSVQRARRSSMTSRNLTMAISTNRGRRTWVTWSAVSSLPSWIPTLSNEYNIFIFRTALRKISISVRYRVSDAHKASRDLNGGRWMMIKKTTCTDKRISTCKDVINRADSLLDCKIEIRRSSRTWNSHETGWQFEFWQDIYMVPGFPFMLQDLELDLNGFTFGLRLRAEIKKINWISQ